MIKFFRKIRQRLLRENKLGTYFLYALGEIVLVVIGILIALQINNWNENKKVQLEEIKILSNLRVDLENTITEFESAITFNKSTILEIRKIEAYEKNKLPYSEELDFSFGVLPHFYYASPTNSTYKSLQTIGIGIIKNEILKNEIVNMYDVVLEDIIDYNEDENLLKSLTVTPFYSKNIRYLDTSVYKAKPNNYKELIDNNEFLNILGLLKRQRKRGVEKYDKVIRHLRDLIAKLTSELDSRS